MHYFNFLIVCCGRDKGFFREQIFLDGWWLLKMSLTPIVQTKSGTVEGCAETSSQGRQYLAFKGVPFAQVPQRFLEPIKVKPWAGIKQTKQYRSACRQMNSVTKVCFGSEDCLFLNLFTRAERVDEKLPVIIWIHGGAYIANSGNDELHGPVHAMNEKMVFVTINYRLGPLGFMQPMDGIFPENVGLKDQRLAMEWVKQNVEHFGGNPDNITLMGESAGASSVWHHYLHPDTETDELFHKIIMQSGSPNAPWASLNHGQSQALVDDFLKELLGESIPDKQSLASKLDELEVDKILGAAYNVACRNPGSGRFVPYFQNCDQSKYKYLVRNCDIYTFKLLFSKFITHNLAYKQIQRHDQKTWLWSLVSHKR